jgi:heat shock protein HtpX
MIPSPWFRRVLLMMAIVELGAAILWIASYLTPNPADEAFSQTVAMIVFLLTYYTGAPLAAKFLAPHQSDSDELQLRLKQIVSSMPVPMPPITLYDHPSANAIGVGILPQWSRVYVTTGLLNSMSDQGIRGLLAHERTHVVESHVMMLFTYSATYALLSHLFHSGTFTLLGLLVFFAFRRYLEYRADAGAKRLVGMDADQSLKELEKEYPTGKLSRVFVIFSSYPTLPMRQAALVKGYAPLF